MGYFKEKLTQTLLQPCEDCIGREDAIKEFQVYREYSSNMTNNDWVNRIETVLKDLPSVAPKVESEDKGEISDGYHTFNQLYHQRAILFATIVNQNKDKAWKSFKHSDGEYCFDRNGEWFIVGIDTPQGSYTYHYAKEYWDYFDCKELECAKIWDGHTEEDVTRLLSLEKQPCEDYVSCERVKQLFLEWAKKQESNIKSLESISKFFAMLDALPSVTPKVESEDEE